MKNKICLITGGNAGIGRATALELAKQGATVVLLCRSKQRGEEAVDDIKAISGNPNVDLMVADLASQNSVKQAVHLFKLKYDKLHILINNAAVFLAKREVTEDGIEKTFATNYLSHFLLTLSLLDVMKRSGGARIINVASKHYGIKLDFDDLMLEKKYSVFKAVGPTKLGLVIFAKELIFNLISASPEKGARTSVYVATSPEVQGMSGRYFEKCKEVSTSSGANDETANRRLWELSMKLSGLNEKEIFEFGA